MKKIIFIVVLSLVVILVLVQWIPISKRNPPVTLDISTPPEVKVILKRSCYDCHSNETVWPWYSDVAPVSWLVVRDVREGRDKLNFSTWDQYNAEERAKKLRETWEEIEEGEMPTWYYTAIHRDARLSPEDRELLRTWSTGALQEEHAQEPKGAGVEKATGSQ